MLRTLILLPGIVFLWAACGPRPVAVLSPPPRENVSRLADQIDIDLEGATIVFVDTMPARVWDAATGERAIVPYEAKFARAAARHESGNVVPRFRALEGGVPSDLVKDHWVRESLPSASERLTWTPIRLMHDSLDYHKSWRVAYYRLNPASELAVRSFVWPTSMRVVERVGGEVTIATDWVDFAQFSERELRCVPTPDSKSALVSETPALRMVARLRPIPNGGARIVVRYETRGLSACRGSTIAQDRLAAFRFDVWNGVNHASVLGRSDRW